MNWFSHMNVTIPVNVNQWSSYFASYCFYVVSFVQIEKDNDLCGSKAPWTFLNSDARLRIWQIWLKGNGLPAFLELNLVKNQEILRVEG